MGLGTRNHRRTERFILKTIGHVRLEPKTGYVICLKLIVPLMVLRSFINKQALFYFRCYTVHVVESLNYYTNYCTYIKFIKFTQ